MSLRPTRRRNGQMYATIRVPFHLARESMTDVLVYDFWSERDHQPEPTKAAVEDAIRTWYAYHGGEADMSLGDALSEMDDDERAEASEWAEEQLTRLWPEWT